MLLIEQLILALVQDTCFICWWNVPYCQCSGSGGVCLLPGGSSVHSPYSACEGSTAARCASLLCFGWESVCNFPPLLPQRQEMNQCRCSDSMNCFCFIVSCERKEESFPVVKVLGKDCYCMSCWNFSGFYLWRIKTSSPFPGFEGTHNALTG